ncbi:MAG: NUDIX hydrolase [SAR202 cluster bacterium]|nr:NUDIX hydrolase [SAR202 cluster bacterium]
MANERSMWKWRTENLVSAGGVVYRGTGPLVEVAMCGRIRPRIWVLPKGTANPGETVEETALREVREETGLEVVIEEQLPSISYWFVRAADGVRCHKTVHFFLMRAVGGSPDLHDPEFDEVEWAPATEVLQRLTHANEAKVVEKALALVKAKSGDTRESPAG